MKKMLFATALAASVVGCTTAENAAPVANKCVDCKCAKTVKKSRPVSPSCRQSKLPFKLGIARYTLHRKTFDEALEMMQDMDCHYMGFMEKSLKYDATDAEIAAYKAKAAKYGVEVVSAGPLYYRTEEELKACMEFAKRYGMKYISVVPYEWNPKIANVTDNKERAKIIPGREWRLESDKMMDLLEKYRKGGIHADHPLAVRITAESGQMHDRIAPGNKISHGTGIAEITAAEWYNCKIIGDCRDITPQRTADKTVFTGDPDTHRFRYA